ncbi:MAG: DUF4402 domain-containing protein [Alteromonadales bacterium]|nr:DUF4402 domain-containing protein [Alteromonadales bacterium]MCP4984714.1 DUF4402 domain-containing protein [Colwellia sp.]
MQLIKQLLQLKIQSLLMALTITFVSFTSLAAVTVVDKLSFGTIAILDNNTSSDITIHTNGKTTITNHIRIIDAGKPGYFILSSFPGYTQLFTTANILVAKTSSNPPTSEQFTLINLTTAPSVYTNGTGIAEVYIGGTFRTSGSGTGQYYDTLYTASIELSISY